MIAVCRWIKKNQETNKKEARTLLTHILLPQCSELVNVSNQRVAFLSAAHCSALLFSF